MKEYRKYFIFCILFVMPIIIANVYYIDDLGRATIGYTRWGIDGRPLSDLLMTIINLNPHITDISPFPLIISCLILSVSFYHYRMRFLGKGDYSFIIPLTFLCSPYFAEVLSYKFDVLPIVSAIGIAFLFINSRITSLYKRFAFSVLCVVAIQSFYQVVINVLVILCIIEFFYYISNNTDPKEILKILIERVASVVLGIAIYLKVVMPLSFNGIHSSSHPEIGYSNLYSFFIRNINQYYGFISKTITHGYGTQIILLIFAISVISTATLLCSYNKKHKNALSLFLFVIGILSVPIAFLSSLGGLLFLQTPIIEFTRVYVGVNSLFLFVSTVAYYAFKRYRVNIIPFACVVPLLYATSFMYSYGNAIKEQNEYNKIIINQMITDTSSKEQNTIFIVFNGKSPLSPVVVNSIKNYPAIKYLVVDYLSNWRWPFQYMLINGFNQRYPTKESGIVNESISKICTFNLVKKSLFYNMYSNNDVVIFDFDKKKCG